MEKLEDANSTERVPPKEDLLTAAALTCRACSVDSGRQNFVKAAAVAGNTAEALRQKQLNSQTCY